MKKCPNCQTEQAADAVLCDYCGNQLAVDSVSPDSQMDDGLDFVVTEAHDGDHELVGRVAPGDGSDLGLQSNADVVNETVTAEGQDILQQQPSAGSEQLPIGQSEPPLPPSPDYSGRDAAREKKSEQPTPVKGGGDSWVQKLSDAEVKSIKQNLYGDSDNYLSDDEKLNLLKSIDSPSEPGDGDAVGEEKSGFDTAPIVPPKKADSAKPPQTVRSDRPKPKMARRARGLAFFVKNIIQITGEQELHEDDELSINERPYLLKKKTISTKMIVSVLAPVAAVFVFALGAYFTQDATGGSGRIVGVALDLYDRPFIEGAVARLPGLGKSYRTGAQGFFRTDLINAGSYKVEYIINDQVAATDYVTVVAGEVSTITLRPEAGDFLAEAVDQPVSREVEAPEPTEVKSESSVDERAKTASTPTKPKAVSKPRSEPQYAKVKLDANVDGARLKMDGSVVGAGNLTYAKLRPGQRSYTVSAEGYKSASGKVKLVPGETTVLTVALEPITAAQKQGTFLEEDYFYSGQTAMKAGDYERAVQDFTEAVRIKPSYAAAYDARAEAYANGGMRDEAVDDYIRAAEQYRFKRDHNAAITAYNHALDWDGKSIVALLGRASLYLGKGEEIPAIADFETIIRIDRRNAQAYFGLGEARFNQGYYKKAIKHFKDAKSLDAKNPAIYQFLMLSYLGANDVKNVKKTYDKFRDLASEEDMTRFDSDVKYAAVRRLVGDGD